jgi:hypothetical protein
MKIKVHIMNRHLDNIEIINRISKSKRIVDDQQPTQYEHISETAYVCKKKPYINIEINQHFIEKYEAFPKIKEYPKPMCVIVGSIAFVFGLISKYVYLTNHNKQKHIGRK